MEAITVSLMYITDSGAFGQGIYVGYLSLSY